MDVNYWNLDIKYDEVKSFLAKNSCSGGMPKKDFSSYHPLEGGVAIINHEDKTLITIDINNKTIGQLEQMTGSVQKTLLLMPEKNIQQNFPLNKEEITSNKIAGAISII